jgi:hypothetical protein
MKEFWIYLAVWLFGVIVGFILGVIIDKDTVYKGNFRIKQRGKGNVQQPNIEVTNEPKKGLVQRIKDGRAGDKKTRAERKAARKA